MNPGGQNEYLRPSNSIQSLWGGPSGVFKFDLPRALNCDPKQLRYRIAPSPREGRCERYQHLPCRRSRDRPYRHTTMNLDQVAQGTGRYRQTTTTFTPKRRNTSPWCRPMAASFQVSGKLGSPGMRCLFFPVHCFHDVNMSNDEI